MTATLIQPAALNAARPAVQIRPLDDADLDAVARIHRAAFPDSALTRLGWEATRRYYRWQLHGPHDVVALGAWRGDALQGFCFGGVFRGAMGGFVRTNRRFLIACVVLRPWLVGNPIFRERLLTGMRVLLNRSRPTQSGPGIHPSFGILAIATAPQFQASGVGTALMAAAEAAARRSGFREMKLSVHPGNASAIAFYERLGWRKLAPGAAWHGSMGKQLAP